MRLPIQSMQAVLIKPVSGDEDAWFRSVVVDFTPDKELVIVLPQESDRVVEGEDEEEGNAEEAAADERPDADDQDDDEEEGSGIELLFSRGTRVEVEISFPDGIRRFASVVSKLDLSFGGAIRVDWPDEGTRIQRRDYVRVEAAFRAVAHFQDAEQGKPRTLTGATMDLSAGGARLQLKEPIPDDQRVELDIDAGPLSSRRMQGRVVRSAVIERKNARPNEEPDYWVAVEFLGVDEALRKELTQLVFDIQRQLMRRSLT